MVKCCPVPLTIIWLLVLVDLIRFKICQIWTSAQRLEGRQRLRKYGTWLMPNAILKTFDELIQHKCLPHKFGVGFFFSFWTAPSNSAFRRLISSFSSSIYWRPASKRSFSWSASSSANSRRAISISAVFFLLPLVRIPAGDVDHVVAGLDRTRGACTTNCPDQLTSISPDLSWCVLLNHLDGDGPKQIYLQLQIQLIFIKDTM
jgi:hypothetical protein